MTRVVWTNAEKEKVRQQLVNIFLDAPWKTNATALGEAQAVLPLARRIKVTHNRVHSHKGRIHLARKSAEEMKAKRDEIKRETLETAIATGIARPVFEAKRGTTERLAAVFDEILDILADKMADRLRQQMPSPEQNRTFTRVKHNPEPPPSAPREAKTGILVIGLLGDQIEALPIYPFLDITFLGTEQALAKDTIRRADTILMTKFINHAVQEKYRKAPELHYCNGGTTELAKLLMSIAIKEHAKNEPTTSRAAGA